MFGAAAPFGGGAATPFLTRFGVFELGIEEGTSFLLVMLLVLCTGVFAYPAGLLGDRYVSLQVGGDDKLLQPGDQITMTESAVLLERVIGKLIYSSDRGKSQ